MKFTPVTPPAALQDCVRFFYILESDAPGEFGTVADGSPGILLQRQADAAFIDHRKGRLPAATLYGQTIKPRQMRTEGSFSVIGAYLHPHALPSIFGFDAHELTDDCLDLNAYNAGALPGPAQRLAGAASSQAQIQALAAYLSAMRSLRKREPDPAMLVAADRLIASRGRIDLGDLRRALQISERSLERRFKRVVGVSPRLFARICRFQSAVHSLQQTPTSRLTDVAFDQDYSDQSHFIRAFREFAGCTPREFRRQPAGLEGIALRG